MIAVKNMRKSLTILVALLMAVTAFAVVASAEESDASVVIDGKKITDSGFKEDKKGTLKVWVNNTEGHAMTISVWVKENGKDLLDEPVKEEVNDGSDYVSVSFKLSKGTHIVDIFVDDGVTVSSSSHEIEVEKNVWSNVVTYVAVALIAIVVIIIAVVYMRANPKNKPTTTFTQLENEKKAATAEEPAAPVKTEKKQYKASTEETGKIKYTSSRRK